MSDDTGFTGISQRNMPRLIKSDALKNSGAGVKFVPVASDSAVPERVKDAGGSLQGDVTRISDPEEGIERKILAGKRERTGDFTPLTAETDPGKTRMFTSEPAAAGGRKSMLSEKPGVVLKPGEKFIHPEDLTPMPTVVAAEDEREKIIQEQSREVQWRKLKDITASNGRGEAKPQEKEELDNQIIMEGFIPGSDEKPDHVNEFEVEKELIRSRREKAKGFRLSSSDGQDASEMSAEDLLGMDETSLKKLEDVRKIRRELVKISRKKNRCLLAVSLLTAVMFLGSLIAAGSETLYGFFFKSNNIAFLIFNFTLLFIVGILYSSQIAEGIRLVIKRKPNTYSSVFAALLIALVQGVLLLNEPDMLFNPVNCYAPEAAFLCVIAAFGDYLQIRNTLQLSKACTKKEIYYTAQKVRDSSAASEFCGNIYEQTPNVRYSARSLKIGDFRDPGLFSEPDQMISGRLFWASLIAAVVVGGFAWLNTRNFLCGFSAFAGTAAITVPVNALLPYAVALFTVNKSFKAGKSCVTGYKAASEAAETQAVLFDANEVFDSENCQIYGIKPFNGMRIDDAILYTASVICAARAPLAGVFEKILLERKDLLLPVEGLIYEEKLGLSAWVNNHRVLVGSRDLLTHHSIDVPGHDFESKYYYEGRQLIYLAVEGKISAMLVVSYGFSASTAQSIKALTEKGIVVLLRTTDPNINREMVEKQMGVEQDTVKIVSPRAAEEAKSLFDDIAEAVPASLVHNGGADSFLDVLKAAMKLNDVKKVATPVLVTGFAAGVLLMLVLVLLSWLPQAGSVQLILFIAIRAAIGVALPLLVFSRLKLSK